MKKDVKQTKVLLKYIYSSTVSSAHGGTRRPMQSRLCINCYGYYLIGGLQFGSVCAETETGDPARLTARPGCWAMGTNKDRKIIFCTGLTRAAKAGQKSIVAARRVQ